MATSYFGTMMAVQTTLGSTANRQLNGNVQWTLATSLAYTDSPVKMSPLGSDAIIVTGSGSAGCQDLRHHVHRR